MMNILTMYAALIYSVVLSAFFSVKILIVMSAIPTIMFLMTSYFLPESPMWLMKKGICSATAILYLLWKYEISYFKHCLKWKRMNNWSSRSTFIIAWTRLWFQTWNKRIGEFGSRKWHIWIDGKSSIFDLQKDSYSFHDYGNYENASGDKLVYFCWNLM